MEVQSTFDYSFPDYECYHALKDHVLPELGIVYWYGYAPLVRIPLAKINVKIIEEHEPACFLKGKMRIIAYNLVPYTIGPELNFYCSGTGNNLCTVEMISQGALYGNYLLNLTVDLAKQMSPKFMLKMLPKVYFDGEVVYDKSTYLSASYRDDANVRAYKYIFRKAGEKLGHFLKNKFIP